MVAAPRASLNKQEWEDFCYGALLDRTRATLVLSPRAALQPKQTFFVYFEPFNYGTDTFDPPVLCPPSSNKFALKREDRIVVEVQGMTAPVTPLIRPLMPQVQIRYRAARTLFPPDGVYFGNP